MSKATPAEREEARNSLLTYFDLQPGRRIYALEQKSRASSAVVVLFVIDGDRILQLPPSRIAALTGYPTAEGDGPHMGNRVRAGGMDRKFELVGALGAALWPNGTPEPHGMRNGKPDSEGEFALKMERL
jgi:hypothetical protein